MLIYDFSQALYGSVYSLMSHEGEITKEGLRIKLLDSVIKVHQRFKNEHGKDIVLALDSVSWRKKIFSLYKHKRKKKREEEKINWDDVFVMFDSIIEEFDKYLPYKIIKVDGCEGDDVIAILSKYIKDDVLIVGVDKDYQQLHLNENVKQYNPLKNSFIEFEKEDIPYNLFKMICRGDDSDGICSIINSDDCFAKNIRQKPLKEVYIKDAFNAAKQNELKEFLGKTYYKRFEQNRTLIDFRFIPEDLRKKVIDKYINYPKKKSDFYGYIRDFDLKNFTTDVMKL